MPGAQSGPMRVFALQLYAFGMVRPHLHPGKTQLSTSVVFIAAPDSPTVAPSFIEPMTGSFLSKSGCYGLKPRLFRFVCRVCYESKSLLCPTPHWVVTL
jgi:hypothetical protein